MNDGPTAIAPQTCGRVGTELSRDAVVRRLRTYGVTYLAGADPVVGSVKQTTGGLGLADGDGGLEPNDLIAALSVSEDPRLRLALIPLFVLHPELAGNAALLADRLPADQALDLQTFYTAAVYLQAFWWTSLHLYKSELQRLPDLFSGRLGLPSVDERHGKVGLHALADSHAARSAYPFNWLASYQRTMDMLFEELKLRGGTS